MTSRPALVLAVALLAATSGCVALITGSTVSFSASDVRVSQSALEETGYQVQADRTVNVTHNVTAYGQERTLAATNHVARYQRSLSIPLFDDPVLASLTVQSTPAAEVAGQTLNPVASQSERELVGALAAGTASLEGVSHRSNRSVRILGANRTVEKFQASATFGGGFEVDVFVHAVKFRHGEDFVVAVAIHPQELSGEQRRVDTLFRGIEH